jgi:hypothetical protein
MEYHSSMLDDAGNRIIDVWMAQGKNYVKQHFVLYESIWTSREAKAVFLLPHHVATFSIYKTDFHGLMLTLR